MGKKSGPESLTNEQLGRPMQNSAFMQHCGLSDSANADICVAVKKGKPLGVSVSTSPMNNKVAACIDKATRKLAFPLEREARRGGSSTSERAATSDGRTGERVTTADADSGGR